MSMYIRADWVRCARAGLQRGCMELLGKHTAHQSANFTGDLVWNSGKHHVIPDKSRKVQAPPKLVLVRA
jgi:hypothetical protein